MTSFSGEQWPGGGRGPALPLPGGLQGISHEGGAGGGGTILQLPQPAAPCQGRGGRQQGPCRQAEQGHILALALPKVGGLGHVSESL